MSWIARQAGRLDEMSQGKHSLRIEIHADGDVVLCIDDDGIPIENEQGNKAQVEFCSTSGGGGRSPRTRLALIGLLKAMAQDNRDDPSGVPEHPIDLAKFMERE